MMSTAVKHRQTGMLLPVALFLLVILSAMGVYAMRLVILANSASILDMQGAAAYQAALAGNQWAAYQIYQPDSSPAAMQACPATTTLIINGFSVVVNCTSQGYVDRGSQSVTVYEVSARATRGTANTPDFIERQATVTLSRCLQVVSGSNTNECS